MSEIFEDLVEYAAFYLVVHRLLMFVHGLQMSLWCTTVLFFLNICIFYVHVNTEPLSPLQGSILFLPTQVKFST